MHLSSAYANFSATRRKKKRKKGRKEKNKRKQEGSATKKREHAYSSRQKQEAVVCFVLFVLLAFVSCLNTLFFSFAYNIV